MSLQRASHVPLLLSLVPTPTGSLARVAGPQGHAQTPHLHPAPVVLYVLGVPVRERVGEGLQALPCGPTRQVPDPGV